MGEFVGRAERLTRALKKHDRELYVAKGIEGKLCLFRNSTRWESYELDSNVTLTVARPAPFLIFALTDNFKPSGREVEWGVLPILRRLDAHDLHKRDLVEEQEKQYEEKKRAEERAVQNENEAFLKELRPQFKKVFADVNTSNMAKIDRRRKHEE